MKWEHKIGIGITCTFLCLIGAVIGLKMQEQTPPESPKVAAADTEESAPSKSEAKNSISFDDLGMPLPDSPPPPPRRSPSPDNGATQSDKDGVPTPSAGTRESPEKNAMKRVKDDVPTPSAGKKDTAIVSATPPRPVEPPPTAAPVIGAGEWGTSPSKSKEEKPKPALAAPKSDPKAAPSALLVPEVKKQQPTSQPGPSMIVPAAGIDLGPAPAESPNKPAAASPSPPAALPSTSPETVSPPPPPAAASSTNGAAAPELTMPSYFSQQPTNAPKPPDPKANEKTSPLAPTPAVKASDMPEPYAPSPQAPAPSATPAIGSPSPAAPPPPAPTAPPPSMPAAGPVIISGPTTTPTPAPPAASPPLPKPPADGSSFIPDKPSAASGPVGVRPAPLPFPVPPSSSPLASAPEKPAMPRLISNGPSVTVYDEQDYSCRPGDTWEGISKQFYMTDRYAKALQRHNQNHARASDRIKDNGQLAAGERIFVPQSYVLEQRYADAIPIPAAASAPTTTPVVYPSGAPATSPAPLPPPKP